MLIPRQTNGPGLRATQYRKHWANFRKPHESSLSFSTRLVEELKVRTEAGLKSELLLGDGLKFGYLISEMGEYHTFHYLGNAVERLTDGAR